VERRGQEGIVDPIVVMKRGNEWGELVLGEFDHFVFALIDCALDTVGFVVVHGVSDREAAHEVGDPWFVSALVFA